VALVHEQTLFQTHYFSENPVAPGIEPETFGSVARNSNHYTTEVVIKTQILKKQTLWVWLGLIWLKTKTGGKLLRILN
jgi:hypothetical protein